MAGPKALARSSPSAQGVSARGVLGFLDAVGAAGIELHSLMVLRHGRVVAEGWWRPYAPDLAHALFSLSKSFTSTAVGLAVGEGRLSVDDRVVGFFPGDPPDPVPPHLADMRVRHLLVMGTGHAVDTTERLRGGAAPNWVRAFLHLPVAHPPGGPFLYNSGATYMLSAIVQKVTGQTLLEYLTPRLFEPLGIAGATWETSPQGITVGGWGLSITTEDIARFGQLYLQRGRWDGREVVPASWVDQATAVQIRNGEGGRSDWAQGYGYQFWRSRNGAYRGDGAHGQFCVVMPEQDAVVAITAGTPDLQGVLDRVWDHLLPAMGSGSPGGAEQDAALSARLASLSLPPSGLAAGPRDGPPPSAAWNGRTYRFADNPAGLESLSLTLGADGCRLRLSGKSLGVSADCGWGRWRKGESARVGGRPGTPLAAHAAWEPDGALRLDWRWVLTPFGGALRICADGDAVAVNYRSNLGAHAEGVTLRASPGPKEESA